MSTDEDDALRKELKKLNKKLSKLINTRNGVHMRDFYSHCFYPNHKYKNHLLPYYDEKIKVQMEAIRNLKRQTVRERHRDAPPLTKQPQVKAKQQN